MKRIKFFAIITLIVLVINSFSGIAYGYKMANDLKEYNEVKNQADNVSNDVIDNVPKDDNKDDIVQNEVNGDIDNVLNNVEDEVDDNIINEDINEVDNSVKNNIEENVENIVDDDINEDLEDQQIDIYSNSKNVQEIRYRTHIQDIGWQDYKANGDTAGTSGKNLRLEAIQLELKNYQNIKVKYQVHIQDIGWQDWKSDGELAGTENRSLRLEAIKICLDSTDDFSVMYRVHIQDIGWQDWKADGELAGTENRNLRLEAIEVKIVPKIRKGLICFQSPVNNTTYYTPDVITVTGWKMADVSNTKIKAFIDGNTTPVDENLITYVKRPDVISAISGYGTIIENPNPGFVFNIDGKQLTDGKHTIKIQICTSNSEVIEESTITINIDRAIHVQYKSHIEDIGWQNYVMDGVTSGTSGRNLRVEALNVNLINAPKNIKIKYRTHIQDIGWQDWKSDGELAGTENRSLRLEAIKICLDSTDDFSVMYRVHIQDIGWQDWKADGELAGTENRSLRLEAVEIKIVPKIKKGLICFQSPMNNTTYYTPDVITVTGWRMTNISNSKMKVFIDSSTTPVDENLITYVKRPDVISAISGYGTIIENPNPGFVFNIEGKQLTDGKHTIKIQICTSNSEIIEESSITINVDRALHVQYRTHLQDIGWLNYVMDGNTSGTVGRDLRIEALNINLINAPKGGKITYRTHIQDLGWQDWKSDGAMTGTEGRGFRVEAIQIKLEDLDNYTVEYQAFVQNIGWTNWYIDGETAGTVGRGFRVEAIKIRIVPNYKRGYRGIDVSEFNNSINWGFVKRDRIDFAMIRVGYRGYGQAGNFKEDRTFRTNIDAAKRAGVEVGIYFFTQAITEAEAYEEADWVINILKNYDIDYPVAIDVEKLAGRTDHLSKEQRTLFADIFCRRIQQAGYIPMIYTNIDGANNMLNMDSLQQYDTWIAHYKHDPTLRPDYDKSYAMWQYTSSGTVNGILGNVDMNICYKRY